MVFMINVLSLFPQEPTVYIQIQSMAPKKKGTKRDAKKTSKSLIKSGKEQVVKKKGKGKGVKSNVKEQIVKRKGKKELSLREMFSSLVSDKDDGKALKESKGDSKVDVEITQSLQFGAGFFLFAMSIIPQKFLKLVLTSLWALMS